MFSRRRIRPLPGGILSPNAKAWRRTVRTASILSPAAIEWHRRRARLVGGERFGEKLFFVFFAARVLRHFAGRSPQSVALERLKPGQAIHITTIPAVTRRERKAARR